MRPCEDSMPRLNALHPEARPGALADGAPQHRHCDLPTDGMTAEALLESADGAMYRAKHDRSGYAFFERRADV